MSKKPENEKPLDLSVKIEDERYPVTVYVGDDESIKLFFNPADPFLSDYITHMEKVELPDSPQGEAYDKFIAGLEYGIDGIFGTGSARLICRHIGVRMNIINGIMSKVAEGQKDFEAKADAAIKEEKRKAAIEAKKQGSLHVVQ